VVNSLATFIKSYNSIMDELRPPAITEEERRNHMEPLSQERRASMSDDDIASYMARYDALHRIQIIQRSSEVAALLRELRSNIMNTVNNNPSKFNSLSHIGFTIAGNNDITITRKGFLLTTSTDLEDIKQAIRDNEEIMNNLTNNSDDVYQFFTSNRDNEESWARRYERMINNYQTIDGAIGSKTRVDSALEKQLQNIAREVERQTLRAENHLEMLWRQFTHMETRISHINSQSQYVMAMLNQAMNNNSG
jgi:flagellar hook-associated protein 2